VADGIRLRKLIGFRKRFPGHVLDQILHNARHQYRSTLKEQASFVITGLVIIEMALNIQGHLCYELMQSLLFKNYDAVLGIMFVIFCAVKITDLVVDIWIWRSERHYANLEADEASAGG
jgi:ABC-type dipeptide/oligopeptide/nickel transport system permease component